MTPLTCLLRISSCRARQHGLLKQRGEKTATEVSPKNSDLLIKYLKLFINNILSICERDQLYYVYRSTLFLWTSFWEHSNKINIYLYRIIVGFCTQQTKGAISGTVPGLYELYVWISTYRYKLCGSITCNFVLYNLYFTSHHK